MKCPKCGTENAINAKFCMECGQKIGIPKRCPNCGTVVSGGKFCNVCGARLDGVQSQKNNNDYNIEDILKDDFLDSISRLAAEKKAESEKYAMREKKFSEARSYLADGKFEQAGAIYDELINDEPTDIEAYMGLIRVATENYTKYEGEEIDKSIRIAKRIRGKEDLSECDNEYGLYLKAREKYFEKKAAEEEELDPFLLTILGIAYTTGELGDEINLPEAVNYYRRAAVCGYAHAQNLLGNCYEEGSGVEKDIWEAVKWYKKAAEQGYEPAKENLERLGYRGQI